jgi:hypothetical protein
MKFCTFELSIKPTHEKANPNPSCFFADAYGI